LKDSVLQIFEQYPQLAVVISLLLSILVAVLGLIPSVFITAANILFFGFWQGTFISFVGETAGALVAFFLYRKGFKNATQKKLNAYPQLHRLLNAGGNEAFWMVLSLRLIPFVPSGLVTFAAAVGNAGAPIFITASSLGKIPALLMEAYAVYQVTEFGWQGKAILIVMAGGILFFVVRKIISMNK
jgi:uncharacterized membrane protein YdjX (TVP38/TMEM64 family)